MEERRKERKRGPGRRRRREREEEREMARWEGKMEDLEGRKEIHVIMVKEKGEKEIFVSFFLSPSWQLYCYPLFSVSGKL